MPIRTIVKYYLVWQIVLLTIGALAPRWLPLRDGYLGDNWRANFDGFHYLSIAEHGYKHMQAAFFPMYPQAINWLGGMIQNRLIASLIISNLSFLIALILLVKLVELDYSSTVAKYILISLLVFPTSFFFASVYTESLFLVFLLACFYAARRNIWWLAGLLGALASYTRFVGVMLMPALLAEPRRRLLAVLIVLVGLGWYMFSLLQSTGDPLAFIHTQELFAQDRSNSIVLLYQVFFRYGKMIFTVNRADPLYFTILLEAGVGVIFLGLSVLAFVKLRLSYAIFNALAYITPTLTGNLVSVPRYVLVCFPAFILIGIFLADHPRLRPVVWGLSTVLLVVVMSLFSRGYWIG